MNLQKLETVHVTVLVFLLVTAISLVVYIYKTGESGKMIGNSVMIGAISAVVAGIAFAGYKVKSNSLSLFSR